MKKYQFPNLTQGQMLTILNIIAKHQVFLESLKEPNQPKLDEIKLIYIQLIKAMVPSEKEG